MSPIERALAGSASSTAVTRIADQFGTDPAATRDAFAHVIAALTQRMERNTLSRGGLAELVRAIGDPHHAATVTRPELVGSEDIERDGKAILGHILGSKDASRAVAARAARAAGLPTGTIEDMMPSFAAMLMGEVSRAAQGPIDEILRRIPGLDEALDEMRGRRNGTAGDTPFEPSPGGPGQPKETREQDQRRASTDRIPDQQPLPVPGETTGRNDGASSRYDDLSDILRRGGIRLPKGEIPLPDGIPGGAGEATGGTLYNIVRALIGALLGFQSRGLLGWLVRIIVLRWGWGFIRSVLGRILGRVILGR